MPCLSDEEYSLYILTKENNTVLINELENEKKLHEEAKQKLQECILKNNELIKENEDLRKKLKGKVDLIHSFANRFPDWKDKSEHNRKRIVKLSNNLEKIMVVSNITQVNTADVMLKLQDISQVCGNCREENKKMKEKCAFLNDSNMNFKFINEQLCHRIDNLNSELNTLKADAQIQNKKNKSKKCSSLSLLPPTPDSVSTEDSNLSTFSDLSSEKTLKSFSLTTSNITNTFTMETNVRSLEFSTNLSDKDSTFLKPNENDETLKLKTKGFEVGNDNIFKQKNNVKDRTEVFDCQQFNRELRNRDECKFPENKFDVKNGKDSVDVKNKSETSPNLGDSTVKEGRKTSVLKQVSNEAILDKETNVPSIEEVKENGFIIQSQTLTEQNKASTYFKNNGLGQKSIFSHYLKVIKDERKFSENKIFRSSNKGDTKMDKQKSRSQEENAVVENNNDTLTNLITIQEDLSVTDNRKTCVLKPVNDKNVIDVYTKDMPLVAEFNQSSLNVQHEAFAEQNNRNKTSRCLETNSFGRKSIFSPCLQEIIDEGTCSENNLLKSNSRGQEDNVAVKNNNDTLTNFITNQKDSAIRENSKTCLLKSVRDEENIDKETNMPLIEEFNQRDLKLQSKITTEKNDVKNTLTYFENDHLGDKLAFPPSINANNIIESCCSSPNLEDFDGICRFMRCPDLIELFDSVDTLPDIFTNPSLLKNSENIKDGKNLELVRISENLQKNINNNNSLNAAKEMSNNLLQCSDSNELMKRKERDKNYQENGQISHSFNTSIISNQDLNNSVNIITEQQTFDDLKISAVTNLSHSISKDMPMKIENSLLELSVETPNESITAGHDEVVIEVGKSEEKLSEGMINSPLKNIYVCVTHDHDERVVEFTKSEDEKMGNSPLDLSVKNFKASIRSENYEAVNDYGKTIEVEDLENSPLDLSVTNTKVSDISRYDELGIKNKSDAEALDNNKMPVVKATMPTRGSPCLPQDNSNNEFKAESPTRFMSCISPSIKSKTLEGSLQTLNAFNKNSFSSEKISRKRTHVNHCSMPKQNVKLNKQDKPLTPILVTNNLVVSQSVPEESAGYTIPPSVRKVEDNSSLGSPDALKHNDLRKIKPPNYESSSKGSPKSDLSNEFVYSKVSKETPCLKGNCPKLETYKNSKVQTNKVSSEKETQQSSHRTSQTLNPTNDRISPKGLKKIKSPESIHNQSLNRLSPSTNSRDSPNNSKGSSEGLKHYNLSVLVVPDCTEKAISKNISTTYSLFASREERGLPSVIQPEKNESLPFDKCLSITIPSKIENNISEMIDGSDKLLMECTLQELNSNLNSCQLGVPSEPNQASSLTKINLMEEKNVAEITKNTETIFPNLNKMDISYDSTRPSDPSSNLQIDLPIQLNQLEVAECVENSVSHEVDKMDVDKENSSKSSHTLSKLQMQQSPSNNKGYSQDRIKTLAKKTLLTPQMYVKKNISKSSHNLVSNFQPDKIDTKDIDLEMSTLGEEDATLNKDIFFDESNNPHFGIINYTTQLFVQSNKSVSKKPDTTQCDNYVKSSSSRVDTKLKHNTTTVNDTRESGKNNKCSVNNDFKYQPEQMVSQQIDNKMNEEVKTFNYVKEDGINVDQKPQILCNMMSKGLYTPPGKSNKEKKPPNTYSRYKIDKERKLLANKVNSTSRHKCLTYKQLPKHQSTNGKLESINSLNIEKSNVSPEINQPTSLVSQVSCKKRSGCSVRDTQSLKAKRDQNIPITTPLSSKESRPSNFKLAKHIEVELVNSKENNLTESTASRSKPICNNITSVSEENKIDYTIKYATRNLSELTVITLDNVKEISTVDKALSKYDTLGMEFEMKSSSNLLSTEYNLNRSLPQHSSNSVLALQVASFLNSSSFTKLPSHGYKDQPEVIPTKQTSPKVNLCPRDKTSSKEKVTDKCSPCHDPSNYLNLEIKSQTEIKSSNSEISCLTSVDSLDDERLYEPENVLKEEHQPSKKMKPCDHHINLIPVDHRNYTINTHIKVVCEPSELLSQTLISPSPSDKHEPADELSSEDEDNLIMDVEDCTVSSEAEFCTSLLNPADIRDASTELGYFTPSKPPSHNSDVPSFVNSTSYIESNKTKVHTLLKQMLPAQNMSREVLKSDVGLSNSEKKVTHFYSNRSIASDSNQQLSKSISSSLDLANNKSQSSTTEYFPNFYTECDISNEKHSVEPLAQTVETKIEDQEYLGHGPYKQKTLTDLIPKGDKILIGKNILQSIMSHHSNNLNDYIKRNVTENRKINSHTISEFDVKKVAEVLKPFILNGVENVLGLINAANQLLAYDCKTLLRGLISVLTEIAQEDGVNKSWMKTLDFVPAHNNLTNKQSVNPRIQAFVALFVTINDKKVKSPPEKSEFFKEALQYIENWFFREMSTNCFLESVLPFLLFTYSCLARLSGSLLRVRQLLYDSFYCLTKLSYTFAYILIRSWPAVLRIQSYYSDPLALVVVHAITTFPPRKNIYSKYPLSHFSYYVQKLKWLLQQRYKLSATAVNPEKLLEVFISRLNQQDVDQAMILLAKRMGETWLKKYSLQQLLAVVMRWKEGKVEDCEAATAIKIMCCICRSLNPLTSQLATQPLFEILKELLTSGNTPPWMQEMVAINLCRLSRLNLSTCIEILLNWKPKEISLEVADQILLNIIARQHSTWWIKKTGGLQYVTRR